MRLFHFFIKRVEEDAFLLMHEKTLIVKYTVLCSR